MPNPKAMIIHLIAGLIKRYWKINSVNPSYFIISEVDRYIEKKNGNKYLIFASTDKNKKVLTK